MSRYGKIPTVEGEPLSLEALVAYLHELMDAGYTVVHRDTGDAVLIDRFEILLGDRGRVTIDHRRRSLDDDATWYVCVWTRDEERADMADAEEGDDAAKARALIVERAAEFGVDLTRPAGSIRLRREQPASNLARIVALARGARLEALFDPYADDTALSNILVARTLGADVARDFRVLTMKNTPTKNYAALFFSELGGNGGIRQVAQKQHRRFMLLSGDRVLILGMSLNHLAHEEAARVEDDQGDRAFFDSEWSKPKTIIWP